MSRIYLVDDHVMVREGLRAVLEAAGHQVLGESAEPTQALAELLRLQPEVLLLDLSLGERSGLELLAELQRRTGSLASPLRVIMLTMSAQPRHVAEALRLGAAGYVLKGAPARELLEAIEQVMQGQRCLGPEVAALVQQAAASHDTESATLASLSPREQQILTRVVQGQSSALIGQTLHLSPKTVDTYRSRLMAKLGTPDVPALVRWAIRQGLISA